ncbi:MAG TPA: hypothetical protein VKB72_06195 [Steroidobacteraceae bacterium]|nr:hypothetical protein [Steroidobacteraceae bacterium]
MRARRTRTLAGSVLGAQLLLASVAGAAGGTQLVDDSGSLPYDAPLSLTWRSIAPRHGVPDNTLIGSTLVRVRLNVAPWLRRSGRIYLVLPVQAPGDLLATWTTQGHLLPGSLRPGGRSLVYSGRLTTPFIEDQLQLTFTMDAARLQQLTRLNFHFEIDED